MSMPQPLLLLVIMAGLDLENTQRTFFTAVGRSRKPATTHRNCFPEQGQLF
ncbi:MAG: hypothetical protein AB8B44_04040 [Prochlorococcus sp.]